MPFTSSHARAQGLAILAIIVLFFPSPAFADAQSTATITGEAIFGSGVLVSTFPATPGNGQFALELSSGLFISSGPVQFSNNSSQFTAFIPTSNSTTTVLPEQTATSSPDMCLTGSSVTLTMSSNDSYLGIFFIAAGYGVADPAAAFQNILLDGAPVSDYPTSPPPRKWIMVNDALTTGDNLGFFVILTTRNLKGPRNLCLRVYYPGANSLTIQSDSESKALFGAFEIR